MTSYPPPPPPGDPQDQSGGYYPPQGQPQGQPQPGGYYPPQGQPGGYYQQPQQQRGSGMAITALILGIIALLSCWTIVGGILFGLIAIVLGFMASRRAKRGEAGGRGMAITGIVLGAIGLVLSVVILAVIGAFWNSESAKNLRDCMEQAGNDEAALADCRQKFEDEVVGDQANSS